MPGYIRNSVFASIKATALTHSIENDIVVARITCNATTTQVINSARIRCAHTLERPKHKRQPKSDYETIGENVESNKYKTAVLLDGAVHFWMRFIAGHGDECQIFANAPIDTHEARARRTVAGVFPTRKPNHRQFHSIINVAMISTAILIGRANLIY